MSRSDRPKLIKAVLGLGIVITIMSLCFGLPTVHSGAHHLKVATAGAAKQLAPVEAGALKASPGAYDFKAYGDAGAVRSAIQHRDVAGGLIVADGHPQVLIASAGGGPVAQKIALGLSHALPPRELPVEDVVPYPKADPMGGGIASAGLPLIFGGVLPALVLAKLFRRRIDLRVIGAIAFSLLAGVIVASLLDFVYGTVDKNFWEVAGGIAVGLAAISLPALGLEAMFGMAGFGAMSISMILIGNPLSGLASSPAWLPSPWGAVGQLLPPGASGTLLRSNAYFDGHGGAAALTALGCWVLFGGALLSVAALRERQHRDVRQLATAVA